MTHPSDRWWMVGAFATLVVGAVHVQQFTSVVGDAPTVSELFLLNGIGAGGIVIGLVLPRLRSLAALGGIALSVGALVSVAIALFAKDGIFDYTEPDLRAPIVVAIASELIAVLALSAYLAGSRAKGVAWHESR